MSVLLFDLGVIPSLFLTLLSLFIIWMIIALWAMNKAIGRRPDLPLEVIEKNPNTAWYKFNREIHEGVDWIKSMPKEEIFIKAHDG